MKTEDTLDDLGLKLNKVCNENSMLLLIIKSHENKQVISGYSYSLQFNLPSKEDSAGELFSVVPQKVVKDVSTQLNKWRYSGNQLKTPDDIFNDNIDYEISTYADVRHINDQLLKVGKKISDHLCDLPKTRDLLCQLITNAKYIQIAIKELHDLTVDIEDTLSKNKELHEGINDVSKGFSRVQMLLPNAQLTLSAKRNNTTRKKSFTKILSHIFGAVNCMVWLTGLTVYALVFIFVGCAYSGDVSQNPTHAELREQLWLSSLVNNQTSIFGSESLEGHSAGVLLLDVFDCQGSPCLVSGSDDKTIKIWNINEQRLLGTLEGHPNGVRSLAAFDCKGSSCLASGSAKGKIKLWNLDEQKLLRTIQVDSGGIRSLVVFDCKGSTCLANGNDDGTITLWSMEERKLLGTLRGHSDWVRSLVVFDCKGSTCLTSSSDDGTINIWNMEEQKLLGTLQQCSEGEKCAARSLAVFDCKTSTCLASGGTNKRIKIWNLEKQMLLGSLEGHSDWVRSIAAFDCGGSKCLASSSDRETIKIWSMEEYKLLGTLKGHSGFVSSIATYDCGGLTCLASGSADETIKLWKK